VRNDDDAPGRQALGHWQVLAIALPIIFSNATTPLIGVVDTAVMGRLGPPELIGAVALSSIVFGVVYWAFGFLRMSTTALTAQASGAGRPGEASIVLIRALVIALGAGAAVLLLQWPIRSVSLGMLDASPEALAGAATYFNIRVWSAPATFVNYAFLGWFIGLSRVRTAFFLQLLLNLLNMVLSVAFVGAAGMNIEGVALAALLAEITAAVAGAALAWAELRRAWRGLDWEGVFQRGALTRMCSVNLDILIRTLCLMFALLFFVAQGAKSGDVTLAANAVLFEFVTVFAYLLDGFAMAAEVLTGGAVGGGSLERFRRAFWLSSFWAGVLSVVLCCFCWFAGWAMIDGMTVNPEVRMMARGYLGWTALAPVMGVACFQLDGVFIGATQTADMRNSMVLSFAVYICAYFVLAPVLGNHGLWAALMVFYGVRGVTLGAKYPALVRARFPVAAPGARTG
jgi:multidrug resistance protein, MATE family